MVSWVRRNGKAVLVVDYSDCNEAQMLSEMEKAKAILLSDGRPKLLLSIYNDRSYATPKFMAAINKESAAVMSKIEKQAVVGLNATKKMILKGYNFLFQRNIRAFDSEEEAIRFLVDDTTTDRDFPDYMRP